MRELELELVVSSETVYSVSMSYTPKFGTFSLDLNCEFTSRSQDKNDRTVSRRQQWLAERRKSGGQTKGGGAQTARLLTR